MYVMKVNLNAVKINSVDDIPENMKDTITIEENQIKCLNAEGYGTAPLGTVIGMDKKAPTATGKGAWPMSKDSYVEKDGQIYPKGDIREAEPVKGPVHFDGRYGPEDLAEGKNGFIVSRTASDGSISRNILTEGTSSVEQYVICTKEGEIVGFLTDYKFEDPEKSKSTLKDQLLGKIKGNADNAKEPDSKDVTKNL